MGGPAPVETLNFLALYLRQLEDNVEQHLKPPTSVPYQIKGLE